MYQIAKFKEINQVQRQNIFEDPLRINIKHNNKRDIVGGQYTVNKLLNNNLPEQIPKVVKTKFQLFSDTIKPLNWMKLPPKPLVVIPVIPKKMHPKTTKKCEIIQNFERIRSNSQANNYDTSKFVESLKKEINLSVTRQYRNMNKIQQLSSERDKMSNYLGSQVGRSQAETLFDRTILFRKRQEFNNELDSHLLDDHDIWYGQLRDNKQIRSKSEKVANQTLNSSLYSQRMKKQYKNKMAQIKPEVNLDFDENDFLQIEGMNKFNLEYEVIAKTDEKQEYLIQKQPNQDNQEIELVNTWGPNLMHKISKYMN